MKTILVPTDFSEHAENAIHYAAEIGKLTKARIILFHAYHVPVLTAEVPVVMPSLDTVEKDCMYALSKIERRLHLRYGKHLSVECVCKCGFALDEINEYAAKHKVDLIVMGKQGAGYIAERLVGSITSDLIHKSKCPVLAVDKGMKFHKIRRIVLACDYVDTENKKILGLLREFAMLSDAHIYVLNVVGDPEPVASTSEVVSDFMRLEHSLAGIDHTFHYLKNDRIVEGINEFVTKQKMDMVVMIPRRHTLLKTIFSESETHKMTFHSKVPLLALH